MKTYKSIAGVAVLALFSLRGDGVAVGWRCDGTSRFPDATPPLEWSTQKNVIWKTALPEFSNASPILVGDRIFVCLEPSTLVCINAADGRILWQKSKSLDDVLSEADRIAIDENLKKADQLRAEKAPLDKKMKELQAILDADPVYSGLTKKINELQAQYRKNRGDESLRTQISELQEKCSSIQELKPVIKELDEIKGKVKALDSQISRLSSKVPRKHNVNGYTSPTPVSDGTAVFVVYGTGVAAAYRLDGEELWAIKTEQPTHQWGHSASPVLVGDQLILHVINVVALDKQTGRTLWTTPSKPRWGSPVVTTIDAVNVVITANGEIIRADNGNLLVKDLHGLTYCAPLVQGSVVYFIENGGKAYKLNSSILTGGKPDLLWTTAPHKERYYASPLYHDGLIYAIDQKSNFSVIDAENGEVLSEKNLKLGGTVYPSIAFAGGNLYVSSDSGKTMVIQPGRDAKQIALNDLEGFRCTPLFVKDRIFIRATGNLYCIGR